MPNFLKLEAIAPWIFVLLWSTGWIVAQYSNPYSDPLTFLSVRFCFATIVFVAIAIALKSPWPTSPAGWFHALFSGLFLHAIYLGGVWWAIDKGVPTPISGLLAALQPLMTAMIAYWVVNERLTIGQKLGVVIGFIGLCLAIFPDLSNLSADDLINASGPLLVNVIAMIAVTIGTIYQKRYLQEGGLISIATLQYLGAFIFVAPAAYLLEPMRLDINIHSVGAMIWSVFGLSLGAIMLLLMLIRRGQVSRAASLIYLVPPTVGLEAWLLFGERPSFMFVIGTIIVVFAVWMVNRKPKTLKAA